MEYTFTQNHCNPKRVNFIPNHFHPNTTFIPKRLSSQTSFIQNNIHPQTISSKTNFIPKTILMREQRKQEQKQYSPCLCEGVAGLILSNSAPDSSNLTICAASCDQYFIPRLIVPLLSSLVRDDSVDGALQNRWNFRHRLL